MEANNTEIDNTENNNSTTNTDSQEWDCSPLIKATNFTPLMIACLSNDLEEVDKILSNDPQTINKKNSTQWTALHIACRNSTTWCSIELVRKLLNAGADPNLKNNEGWTPLHLAVCYSSTDSSLETVTELLEEGAKPNLKDNDGSTPLHIAAYYSNTNSSLETVIKLLEKGANTNLKDNDGLTPLHVAINCKCPLAVIVLTKCAGSELFSKDNEDDTPLDMIKETNMDDMIIKMLEEKCKSYSDNLIKNAPEKYY